MRQKSISKTSIQSSGELSPPRIIEMSDKAMRYARRAQQQSKLKRSMSTHLTSTSNSNDPWTDTNHRSHNHNNHHPEGRHLYRSSSRHSLASDTRVRVPKSLRQPLVLFKNVIKSFNDFFSFLEFIRNVGI